MVVMYRADVCLYLSAGYTRIKMEEFNETFILFMGEHFQQPAGLLTTHGCKMKG